jgi:exodeoxyribonuclease-5
MQLSKQQQEAIDYCMNNPNQSVTIFGYAGTGKSTILSELMRRMDEEGTKYIFTAPTNKAVRVLQNKGVNASTLFSFLFKASTPLMTEKVAQHYENLKARYRDTKDKLVLEEIQLLHKQYSTIIPVDAISKEDAVGMTVIIDECSMVGRKVYGEKLEKLGMRIIAVGDPEQLPPVKDELYFSKADFTLTEVFRTALDNPILALATKTRGKEGEWLKLDSLLGNEFGYMCETLPIEEIAEMMKDYDQTICYTNKTRKMLNQETRKARGIKSVIPIKGERLILKNTVIGEDVFVNGEIIEVKSSRLIKGNKTGKLRMRFERTGEDTQFEKTFFGENINLDQHWPDFGAVSNQTLKADYGYAITGHASQGSEYDTVLIVLERRSVNRQWFYTALTRAKQRALIAVVE